MCCPVAGSLEYLAWLQQVPNLPLDVKQLLNYRSSVICVQAVTLLYLDFLSLSSHLLLLLLFQ